MENINELRDRILTPLENPEFYAMIFADNRYTSPNSAFSLCHNLDLGSTTFESYASLISEVLKEYLSNFESFEDYKKIYTDTTEERYNKMKLVLQNQLSNPNNIGNFMKKNHKILENTLGLRTQISEEGLLMQTGWMYFKSKYLKPGKDEKPINKDDIKHRLYLTVDTNYRAKATEEILKKCKEKDLPYYFKVHINFKKNKINQQSDTMVLYLSEDEQVVDYINMIDEILQENEELKQHIHKPSPHLCIVNDYIGYGFEPKMKNERKSYSGLLKESIPVTQAREQALNILKDVSNPQFRNIEDTVSPSNIEYRCSPKGALLKLPNIERCKELSKIQCKIDRTPDEIEELENLYSAYLRRGNMDVKGLDYIRNTIIENLVKEFPDMPQNNLMKIDVNLEKELIKSKENNDLEL